VCPSASGFCYVQGKVQKFVKGQHKIYFPDDDVSACLLPLLGCQLHLLASLECSENSLCLPFLPTSPLALLS
jgi:hypothetical protein